MKTMGQTFRGDLDLGAVMWIGGSLGPVGSPGWRRREGRRWETVKLRALEVEAKRRLRERRKSVGEEGMATRWE